MVISTFQDLLFPSAYQCRSLDEILYSEINRTAVIIENKWLLFWCFRWLWFQSYITMAWICHFQQYCAPDDIITWSGIFKSIRNGTWQSKVLWYRRLLCLQYYIYIAENYSSVNTSAAYLSQSLSSMKWRHPKLLLSKRALFHRQISW